MAFGAPPAALLAFYEDHEHTAPFNVESYDWSGLVELFSEHERTNCAPCPGGQKCKAKFSTAFSPGIPREGKTRLDKNTEHVSMLVYDFDHLWRAELEALCDRLAPLTAILYSTHSHLHGGADDNCVRVIFPFTRPLAPDEFRVVHREVRKRYGLEWLRPGSTVPTGADPNPKDLSRLYFLPTAPVGVEVEFGEQVGELLDLDEILASAPRPSLRVVVAAPTFDQPPVPKSISPVDMESLKLALKRYAPVEVVDAAITNKELVDRVLHGKPLVRETEQGKREWACHQLGSILAFILPEETSNEVIAELVRPSIMSMPVYAGDGDKDTLEERFAKLDYSFRRGLVEREERDKKEAAERRSRAQRIQRLFKSRRAPASASPMSPSLPTPDPVAVPAPSEDDDQADIGTDYENWEQEFLKREGKDGKKFIISNDFNAMLVLTADRRWRGVLRYNELTKNVDVRGGPLDAYETAPSQLATAVKCWLQKNYGIDLGTTSIFDVLVLVAKADPYNPLQDYLDGCEWDGQHRADTMLEVYCGVSTVGSDEKDLTEYVRLVSRRWLVGSAARGLSPGCKFDSVLIFEGETGLRKSTALEILGGEFFSNSKIVIGEKDAMQLAGTNWIHEIAELAAFRGSETEEQKAFFSSPTDNFRPPYGRVIEKFPRLCVFTGTTNEERYLNDHTGNRRYWPVACVNRLRTEELQKDRDKIWAEAVSIYKAGFTCEHCGGENLRLRCAEHRWWFEEDENKVLEQVNQHRLKAEYADAIVDYIIRLPADIRQFSYSIFDIAIDVLKIAPDRISSQQAAIGRALKVLGFKKDRVTEDDGRRTVRHFTPQKLLLAKRQEMRHLRDIKRATDERLTAEKAGQK